MSILEKELEICRDAFKAYGMERNCGFLMEECGELLSAVNKLRRGRATRDDVIGELVDVYQIIIAFAQGLGYKRFLEVKEAKLERLQKEIGKIHTGKVEDAQQLALARKQIAADIDPEQMAKDYQSLTGHCNAAVGFYQRGIEAALHKITEQ